MRAIFLDMDGVLADFIAAALSVHGRSDFVYPLNGTKDVHTLLGVSKEAFYAPLDSADFWAELPKTEICDALLAAVEATGIPTYILSKPTRSPGSAAGKLRWLAAHAPHLAGRTILTGHKHLLAAPGRLLIDDMDGNVREWAAAGGTAVLVPRPWNAAAGTAAEAALGDLLTVTALRP